MPPRNKFAATRRSHRILRALREGARIEIADVCDVFGLQYPQARADLKLLEELYDLETARDGRTKVWMWPESAEDPELAGCCLPPSETESAGGGRLADADIHLELPDRWAGFFERHPLDPDQSLEVEAGRLHLWAERPVTPAVESFVLALVPDVRIHAPGALRERIEDRVKEWLGASDLEASEPED